jgi:hypothetical protein
MSYSSERLTELKKKQPQWSTGRFAAKSLDDIHSMMMLRADTMTTGSAGLPNQVFGLQQQKQMNQQQQQSTLLLQQQQQPPHQQQTLLGIQLGAFSASMKSDARLPRSSYVPNKVQSNRNDTFNIQATICPSRFAAANMTTTMTDNVKSAIHVQPPEAAFRRLSLRVFQDLSSELSVSNINLNRCNNFPDAVASVFAAPQVSTKLPSSFHTDLVLRNTSLPTTTSTAVRMDSIGTAILNEDDLDHLFDDDIESIGEPVALDQGSPFINNNKGIPPAMADQLLRNVMMSFPNKSSSNSNTSSSNTSNNGNNNKNIYL